jgi:chaperonin GroES
MAPWHGAFGLPGAVEHAMKFIPLYERVLIKEMKGVSQIDGFNVPDIAREDFKMGTVVSVGAGYRKENGTIEPTLVREGMTVLFGPHAGTIMKIDGQEFLWMKEGEIGGWIEQ